MRKFVLFGIVSSLVAGFSSAGWAETGLKPVVVSINGSVTVSTDGGAGSPVVEKQAISLGSELASGSSSEVKVSLVPGMTATMKSKTVIRLKLAQITPEGRYGEVELVKGSVACSLKKQGGAKQHFRLVTGPGRYTDAVGTVWVASNNEGKSNMAVLDGTVSWAGVPNSGPIAVPAGSVVMAQVDASGAVTAMNTVNLLDGTATSYPLDGSAPVTAKATASQLTEARNIFNDAVGNQIDNLSSTDKTTLLSLLLEANKALAEAGIAGISASSAGGASGADTAAATTGGGTTNTVTSNNPAAATSPISP